MVWGGYALLMVLAPMLFTSSLSMTMLSQMGIAIIACLAFNMLLGQGGMLSFGHAVYSGLGSFIAIHALNRVSDGTLALPVSLIPLVGGLGGLFFAALLGYVSTKKAGTPFAMITLGVGELVAAMSLMFPGFFGGEGGITGNRVAGQPFFGITFGPQSQLYYLIAIYTFVCTALMFAFTRTPLGRMLNACATIPSAWSSSATTRAMCATSPSWPRASSWALRAGCRRLNFEIVTSEVVGAIRSGGYLLFTFLGGAVFFFGPIIGAVLLVLALVLLSELTQAWLLYLGLVFTFMVMFAPGGIASLIMMNLRVAAFGRSARLWAPYLMLLVTGVVALAGASAMIEMVYHLQLNEVLGPANELPGIALECQGLGQLGRRAVCWSWAWCCSSSRGGDFVPLWGRIQEDIEAEIKRREVAA